MQHYPIISWLSEISKVDASKLGNKAANLGEMASLGLPVPNGFVISPQTYFDFIAQSSLLPKINQIIGEVDIHSSNSLQQASRAIQKMIVQAKISTEAKQQIASSYRQLSSKDVHVAVRASAISSDNNAPSADGRQASYLNICGDDQLLNSIHLVWASLFTPRAIFQRAQHGQDASQVGTAVIVQRMVESDVSGVVFSQHPISNNPDIAAIEAVWGLGEVIDTGDITPDHYEASKNDGKIIKKEIVRQQWQLMRTTNKQVKDLQDANIKLPVSVAWQKKQKISDHLIVELTKLSQKLEQHFGNPQEVEWAYANHTLYLVQSRPVPMISSHADRLSIEPASSIATTIQATPLLSGMPAAAGHAHGKAKIIRSDRDLIKIQPGTIIITQTSEIDLIAAMDVIAGIVADEGSSGSPAIQAAREMGMPAIVGTMNGTKMVKDGEQITIDGTHGKVYEGSISISSHSANITSSNAHASLATSPVLGHVRSESTHKSPLIIPTATKVMVNITDPKDAIDLAGKDIDGVGLLRSELLFQNIGEHPKYLIERGKAQALQDAIYEGVKEVAKAFAPRPVVYRLSDFTSNQYKRLHGGDKFETSEENPDLGFRGAYRHIAESDSLKIEIQAIKKVRQYHKNVWLMVPYVRTPQEMSDIKSIISEEGLYRGGSFKLWLMADLPVNVILLDQFIGAGIDGVSIGSNDLTQLILGLDRHNPRVAAGFDERQEAVMWAMEKIVTTTIRHGLHCSISGQAPSAYPELTRKLVEWGISSISVSPEAAPSTRRLVADAEFELVRMGKQVKRRS